MKAHHVLLMCLFMTQVTAEEPCCKNVLLSASGIISTEQIAVLGSYSFHGVHDKRPYFAKTVHSLQYFLLNIYDGWSVSLDLSGETLFLATRDPELCPAGIQGAWDRNITFDETFVIECDDFDESDVPRCCNTYNVTSEQDIALYQAARLGTYLKNGTYNAHPVYHLHQFGFDSFLYYRKKGLITDGWTIGEEVGGDIFSINTNSRAACPGNISLGFNLGISEDTTFSIVCDEEDLAQGSAAMSDLANSKGPRPLMISPPLAAIVVLLVTHFQRFAALTL